MLWIGPDAQRLRWRSWDNQYVVFDTASGDTHVLNAVSAEILQFLSEKPANEEEILAHLEPGLSKAEAVELENALRATLEQLFQAQIIGKQAAHEAR